MPGGQQEEKISSPTETIKRQGQTITKQVSKCQQKEQSVNMHDAESRVTSLEKSVDELSVVKLRALERQ